MLGKIKNPILWAMIVWDIKHAEKNAKDLWLSKQEVIKLLKLPKEQRKDLFW